jgi:hypothetical protein
MTRARNRASDQRIMLTNLLNHHTAIVAHAARLVREGDEQSHEAA